MGTNDTTWKLRLPSAQLERWRAAAETADMSLSEFVRTTMDWAISEHPTQAQRIEQLVEEREQAPPKPAPPPPSLPRVRTHQFKPDFKKGAGKP